MKLYHLFPALMSLYGDRGNAAILARYAAARGKSPEICKVECDGFGEGYQDLSAVTLEDADVIYLGPGTERARNRALELLRPLAGQLRAAFERGAVMLFTGNAVTLLGQSLTLADGTEMAGLGLLDFTATERKNRYTGDAIGLWGDGDTPAVGFLNRCDRLAGVTDPLFTLRMGQGDAEGAQTEGVHVKNLWATHFIGPVLVKNPALLREVGKALGLDDASAGENGQDAALFDEMERAYQVTREALEARLG